MQPCQVKAQTLFSTFAPNLTFHTIVGFNLMTSRNVTAQPPPRSSIMDRQTLKDRYTAMCSRYLCRHQFSFYEPPISVDICSRSIKFYCLRQCTSKRG